MFTHLQYVFDQVRPINDPNYIIQPSKCNILHFLSQLLFHLDSYVGMDQQLELKLDVKEAPAVVTEHPQWDISESESEKEDQNADESEFTTDSSDEDD